MLDPQAQTVVQAVVRREGRSLLHYVGDAFPWTTPDEEAALAQLGGVIAEERRAIGGLLQFLGRRAHVFPYLGSYPASFTERNFIALEHLLPELVTDQQRLIAALEADLAGVRDAEARDELQRLIALKQRNLATLEALAAAHPETSATRR